MRVMSSMCSRLSSFRLLPRLFRILRQKLLASINWTLFLRRLGLRLLSTQTYVLMPVL